MSGTTVTILIQAKHAKEISALLFSAPTFREFHRRTENRGTLSIWAVRFGSHSRSCGSNPVQINFMNFIIMQDNRQNSRTAHTYANLRHFQTINAGQCLAENQHPLFANQI